MIVKVQASIATNAAAQQVLIYNKKRDIQWEGDLDAPLRRLMKNRQKVFFHAHLKGSVIVIDREAEWKNW